MAIVVSILLAIVVLWRMGDIVEFGPVKFDRGTQSSSKDGQDAGLTIFPGYTR
jgi:hypothetical protein